MIGKDYTSDLAPIKDAKARPLKGFRIIDPVLKHPP